MINPIFTNKYNEEDFVEFIQSIVPCLSLDKKRSETRTGFKSIQQIAEINRNSLDLVVFVAKTDSSLHARVEITKNTYAVLKNHARSNALVAYISDDSSEWRLSLLTTKVTRTKDGIKETVSNPRRFSYVLGPNAKVATPSKMLIGTIDSITDLENKFSLAVVSKEFFTQIATQYSKLVGGTRGEGRKATVFERTLKLGNTDNAINANFAIRLIGRLVFCWFLKQKKGHLNNPLIPSEILSVSAVKKIGDYYHSVCVPLFFEVLNKPQSSRPTFFYYSEFFDKVPFLNGGLFQDHVEDNHKFNRTTGMSERRGVVNVPDIWFSELFQIFEEYNFTIDENTSIDTELSIDPEMLGRIFENLLAEVNPETGASARKSTGSFYTPREIVDFMVEESLIAHLKTKVNISEEKLRALSSYDLDDDMSHPIDQLERKLLVEEIHKITVFDPACGSGAFPIGVLQRLVHMLGILDPECSIYLNTFPPEARRLFQKHDPKYIRKLSVIRECIHGVDIQPIAIDISRLRCFLTLVVDQQVDDNAPNRGIEPLPNLDFKFVCANTLIKPPIHEGPLFGDEFAEALGELIDEYFAPVDQLHKLETARKLQQLISDKTKKELESIVKSYSYLKDEKYKKALAQKNEKSDTERMRINNLWGSYENIFQNKPVGFFDTRYFFPSVFRNGGFDIVIGNPPYVEHKKLKGISSELKKFYTTYSGTADLYIYFYENGVQNLKKEGVLAYITSNKFFKTSYGENLRKYFMTLKINQIIDFTDVHVFEALVSSCILIVSKSDSSENNIKISFANDSLLDFADLRDFVERNKFFLKQNTLSEKIWQLENETSLVLKKKIESESITISRTGTINVYRGVTTGYNPAFIIDEEKRNELIGRDKLNEAIIKSLLQGRNIRKWTYIKTSDYLIFTRKGINIKEYPSIEDHLGSFRKELEPGVGRKAGTYNWFEIQDNTAYYPEFEKEKIIWGLTSDKWTFAYDNENNFLPSNGYILTSKEISIKYLLALLNSKLMEYYFGFIGIMTAGGAFTLKQETVSELPIKDILLIEQKPFIEIVDKILIIIKSRDYLENPAKKEEVKEYEKQIDQMVYKLYGLTEEEIKIVEER